MELWSAITAKRMEGVAREAFGVDPDQGRAACKIANVKDGVFLTVDRISEGSDSKISEFSGEQSVRFGDAVDATNTSAFHVTKSTEFVYKHSSFSYRDSNCV